MRRLALLLVVLAACAETPARQAPGTVPGDAGGAPSVSVGGTVRGLYGHAR